MAKNKNNDLTAEKVNEATNELLLRGESQTGITWAEAFDFAESQEVENMKQLNGGNWLKLDDFGTYVFAFMGMDVANTEEGQIEVVKLTNKKGEEFISSLAVLISTCKKLTQIPTLLKIAYDGDKKGKEGKYKDLKIYTL